MGVLLDTAYLVALAAVSPMVAYRMIRHGRYRDGIAERFGAVPARRGSRPAVWIHGVSLGEVNAARTLVEELHAQLPEFDIVVSASTDTGIAAARRLYGKDHLVFHWPLDFTLSVHVALQRLRPSLVVLMEGEAWPNFLGACNRRGIPCAIVNGRLGADKGYPRYRRLGPLAARLFNRLTAICVQDESYAEMFRRLGVAPDRIHVTGMMKFDSAIVADRVEGQEALAAAMGLGSGERLLVTGGTGPGEESILLDVFARLRESRPDIRLAIVPRKPERFEEVARLIEQAGFPCVRRSRRPDGCDAPADAGAVLLGDTMGELRKFYALSEICFVGRSLVPMGGSDMIEAAALGRPTVWGPHVYNFPQAARLARQGCVQVADAAGLQRQLAAWLDDPAAAGEAGLEAQACVRAQQGATRRNVKILCGLLRRRSAEATPAPPSEPIA